MIEAAANHTQTRAPATPSILCLFRTWCELEYAANTVNDDEARNRIVASAVEVESDIRNSAPVSPVEMAAKAYVAVHVLNAGVMVHSSRQANSMIDPLAVSTMLDICRLYPQIDALVSIAVKHLH